MGLVLRRKDPSATADGSDNTCSLEENSNRDSLRFVGGPRALIRRISVRCGSVLRDALRLKFTIWKARRTASQIRGGRSTRSGLCGVELDSLSLSDAGGGSSGPSVVHPEAAD